MQCTLHAAVLKSLIEDVTYSVFFKLLVSQLTTPLMARNPITSCLALVRSSDCMLTPVPRQALRPSYDRNMYRLFVVVTLIAGGPGIFQLLRCMLFVMVCHGNRSNARRVLARSDLWHVVVLTQTTQVLVELLHFLFVCLDAFLLHLLFQPLPAHFIVSLLGLCLLSAAALSY